MGSLFSGGGTTSGISARQEGLLNELRAILGSELANERPEIDRLRKQLFRDTTAESRAIGEQIFKQGMLQPALQNFDAEIAPRINSGFANYGGTLSSRRGDALAGALGNVYSNVQSNYANLLPTIQAFPLQQTLSQIQGLSGLNAERYRPYNLAAQLATSQIKGGQTPPGQGPELAASAASAALVAAIAFSDRRLKENIILRPDGRSEFSYTSKAIEMGYGTPGRWVGYIAQDLPASAVRTDTSGYLVVIDLKYFPTQIGE